MKFEDYRVFKTTIGGRLLEIKIEKILRMLFLLMLISEIWMFR